ncbi:MAG: hypothetical protein NVS1B11_24690 [Terriglobales bacterium]
MNRQERSLNQLSVVLGSILRTKTAFLFSCIAGLLLMFAVQGLPAHASQVNTDAQGLEGSDNNLNDASPAPGSIASLHSITTVASTVDPLNFDQNPYGLVIVPSSAATTGKLRPADLLVSNLNNAANVMGLGTTVELIRPSDPIPVPVTFFSRAESPIAMVFNANATSLWIANFGFAPDGSQGNVEVVNNQGQLFTFGSINDPRLWGSWGQGFNGQPVGGSVPPAFFDSNVLTGAVYRLEHFPPTSSGPNFAAATITQIAALGHSGSTINDVIGPQGMAWSKVDDTLYVTDPVNNRIVAISQATTTGNVGSGTTIFRGRPLNQPAGLALNPLNGDLLAVNQGDNKLIEIDPIHHRVVAVKILDKTRVINGVGSALFGVAATTDSSGHLVVYFTNDNTNTVNVLASADKDSEENEKDGPEDGVAH